jgi:Family of unknown function (DUF6459)
MRPLHGYEPTAAKHHLSWADLAEYRPEPDRWAGLCPQPPAQVTVDPPDDGSFRRALTKILEVMDGRRHIGQLQSVLADPVYEATRTRLRHAPPAGIRHQLQSFHSCRPTPDSIELCGRVETIRLRPQDRRTQALVARMERHDETWRCVYLRLI